MSIQHQNIWIVTGASRGLGRKLVEEIVERGDIAICVVRRDADHPSLAALSGPNGGRALPRTADVTDPKAVSSLVASLREQFGRIDIAVNNAGYGLIGAIEEASLDEVRAQFEINFFGALNLIQAVLPSMRARRAGRIINITSVSGLAPWAGTGIYTASKYALEGLGQTLCEEVRELGIHVTNVAPGSLRTDFSKRSLKIASRSIADYDGAGRVPQKMFEQVAGREQGDPAKAAKAIYAIAEASDPPMHLVLGVDAVKYVTSKIEALSRDVERWKDLAMGVAHE